MDESMKYIAGVVAAIAGVVVYMMTRNKGGVTGGGVSGTLNFETFFKQYAKQNGVPWLRAMAIGMQESSLKAIGTHPDGVSTGVMGMTQIALTDVNRHFNKAYTLAQMTDPEKCIDAGTCYLSLCMGVLTDLDLATQAYNQGYPRVRNDHRAGLEYLGNVLRREKELKDLAGF